MNQIIHDPTRGWLLLTEKWPEDEFNINLLLVHRNSCLSTAIEIAKEDWYEVEILTGCRTSKEMSIIPNHKPFSVDAEFEVSETSSGIVAINNQTSGMVFKKIARLVKAKEYRLERPVEGGIVGTEIGVKETESQDELLGVLVSTLYIGRAHESPTKEGLKEAKKRFRIERI